MTAAIYFTPDGYISTGDKLMGRHAAGAGFLRAFIETEPGPVIWGHSPKAKFARYFSDQVRQSGFGGQIRHVPLERHDELAQPGCVYFPGPGLSEFAWRRLGAGPRAYSLCGVTHTTASHNAMGAIADLLAAPLQAWDALVCTSSAVRDTVRRLLERQADYLRWRLGATRFELPQLPLIPLGVACDDFMFAPERRAAARAALGIAEGDVAVLFVGRLSFHAKAHPQPMYLALERAAAAASGMVHLIQCGWFANESIEAAFKNSANALGASIRHHYLDGRETEARSRAWAAGDIFISLSDNIQETFGLTPIEAMAAGMPVVVSDWDGYRDTVRDGIDGFCVPTLMPPPPLGRDLAERYTDGLDSYDIYCGHTCELVAVDTAAAEQALHRLIADPALRRQMGAAGRERARAELDWKKILLRYRTLWAELAERRRADPVLFPAAAPTQRPDRPDPFEIFATYPSRLLDDGMSLMLVRGASAATLAARRALALNTFAEYVYPSAEECAAVLDRIAQSPGIRVDALVATFVEERRMAIRRGLVWMMKMDVLCVPGAPAAGG